ncbi:hypothetical protein NUW58_g1641 [Xylaria curta]|uniref:Uncharacterized protein n=1 Tax=Xylaria curta TaxID=42375 RepID=A0ACC1PKV7_9PEZI|nr:hypothetical protein NUW58_g1641 [Xylaria curta]
MFQFPEAQLQSLLEEATTATSDQQASSSSNTMSATGIEDRPRCPRRGRPQSFTMPQDSSDWVSVHSPGSGDDWHRTPSTEEIHRASPAPHHHSTPSPRNATRSNSISLNATPEKYWAEKQEREREQTLIETQERQISDLSLIIDHERDISSSLGSKLSDLFIVMTQNQQHELDKVQGRLMSLQTDAENCLLGCEWRALQQKLHNLNRKLDKYIENSTPEAIAAGTQTDELTLFLSGLLGGIPQMWKELAKLKHAIDDEKARDAEDRLESDEPMPEGATSESSEGEDIDSAGASAQLSVTDILDRYYEFSRLHREGMAARKERLQDLLDQTSTEISRLQADLSYEEGRTANMVTRMMFWGNDLDVSKVKDPATLIKNLELKRSNLKRGSKELENVAKIIQTLPSHFYMIDIRSPGENHASMSSESVTNQVKDASGTQGHFGAAGKLEDMLYITELEAKLKEKQANEKAWAAHFESLHQQELEAKAILEGRLESMTLEVAELDEVVTTVAGKLFEHRERLWGLSMPARQLGEELISTLEKLRITCDKPRIYQPE